MVGNLACQELLLNQVASLQVEHLEDQGVLLVKLLDLLQPKNKNDEYKILGNC